MRIRIRIASALAFIPGSLLATQLFGPIALVPFLFGVFAGLPFITAGRHCMSVIRLAFHLLQQSDMTHRHTPVDIRSTRTDTTGGLRLTLAYAPSASSSDQERRNWLEGALNRKKGDILAFEQVSGTTYLARISK